MKVLITADTVGGVWTYALELMRALKPHGVRFHLATMGRSLSPSQWADVRELEHVTVSESRFKLEWMAEPWEDVEEAGRWLLELEKRFRPDVVHLNGYAHGTLAFDAPVLVVGHSCVLSWWQAVKNEPHSSAHWHRYEHAVRSGLHAADLVVAPTEAMLTALNRHYGPLPKERTAVVANCRDAALFAPAAHKEPIVFAAGRLWDEAKNLCTLCDAAARHRLNLPVVVAGETTEPGRNDATPEVSGGSVRLLGALPPTEVVGWMSRAAIFAHPARYEPFGLSVLEAALSGCALVLGNIPSLREVWGDDAALYVPPDDAAALAEGINRVAGDEGLRRRLAARALDRARSCYTPERTASEYLRAYHRL